MVSKEAFIDYYAEMNFCMPEERLAYFENLLVSTWNLAADDFVTT
jgi:hypothetical protein